MWTGVVESLEFDEILVQACGATGCGVLKSTIEHDIEGTEIFSEETVWEANQNGYYSGAMI